MCVCNEGEVSCSDMQYVIHAITMVTNEYEKSY